MAVGRTPDGRTVASVTTGSAVATLTAVAGAFYDEDVGKTVTGTGVPAARTIASVNADGSVATMNGNGNAIGTATMTLGRGSPAVYGFEGWSPETDAESELYTIAGGAGANAPSKLANAVTPVAAGRARG
jgi:hypothetical protein